MCVCVCTGLTHYFYSSRKIITIEFFVSVFSLLKLIPCLKYATTLEEIQKCLYVNSLYLMTDHAVL